jgi:hypothetical protein
MGKRMKDNAWTVEANPNGSHSFDAAHLCVLMDLRDELKQLNRVFACHNAQAIPALLRRIARNTTKKRRQRATPKKKLRTRR